MRKRGAGSTQLDIVRQSVQSIHFSFLYIILLDVVFYAVLGGSAYGLWTHIQAQIAGVDTSGSIHDLSAGELAQLQPQAENMLFTLGMSVIIFWMVLVVLWVGCKTSQFGMTLQKPLSKQLYTRVGMFCVWWLLVWGVLFGMLLAGIGNGSSLSPLFVAAGVFHYFTTVVVSRLVVDPSSSLSHSFASLLTQLPIALPSFVVMWCGLYALVFSLGWISFPGVVFVNAAALLLYVNVMRYVTATSTIKI